MSRSGFGVRLRQRGAPRTRAQRLSLIHIYVNRRMVFPPHGDAELREAGGVYLPAEVVARGVCPHAVGEAGAGGAGVVVYGCLLYTSISNGHRESTSRGSCTLAFSFARAAEEDDRDRAVNRTIFNYSSFYCGGNWFVFPCTGLNILSHVTLAITLVEFYSIFLILSLIHI